jgi:hypothetical protein
MTDTPEPCDPLERLLAPPAVAADEELRPTVLARTAAVLRRRRAARRIVYAAGLAACYLAGLLSARWLSPAEPLERVVVVRPTPDRSPPAPGKAERPESAADLERKARADEGRRADLYRRAGDLYAGEQGDLEAALRCYSRSLDASAEEDLAPAPDDHWLLMAIKDAREKEKQNAEHEQ